jgi:hypothetical protein
MTPRKRKQPDQQPESSDSPRRKSARLAKRTESLTQQQSRGLSVLSTITEASEAWSTLAEEARERIIPSSRIKSPALQYQVSLECYNKYNISLILSIVKARSRKPSVTSSPHPKRQENAEIVAGSLDKPETCDPSFRDRCLRRDSRRCVITGSMDTSYWKELGCPKDTKCAGVEAAHIIPFAYGSWNQLSVIYP